MEAQSSLTTTSAMRYRRGYAGELDTVGTLRERRHILRALSALAIVPLSVAYLWVLMWANRGRGPVHGLLFFNPLTNATLTYTESCVVLAALLVVSFFMVIACCKGARVCFGIACGLVVWLLMSGLYLAPYLTFHPILCVPATLAGVSASTLAWLLRKRGVVVALASLIGFACTCSVMVPLSTYDGVPIAYADPEELCEVADPWAAGAEIVYEAASGTPLSEMGARELCDVAARVVHVEYEILSIPGREPAVVASITPDCASCYIPSSHTIVLSVNWLREADERGHVMLVECVLHEMAHVYERAMVDGWIPYVGRTPLGDLTPAQLQQWRREMSEPTYPEDDGDRYRAQDIEVRAREYQRTEIYRYLLSADVGSEETKGTGLARAGASLPHRVCL